jgi:hypothetical protein
MPDHDARPVEIDRRRFIGFASAAALACFAPRVGAGRSERGRAAPSSGAFAFLEAEGFDDPGGWELDQQSMDQMGSPYLLAHGLGIPVRDAVTTVRFPAPGRYRVWVRTRDWVAPWNAPGAPGRFRVLIDGEPLGETFGTTGAEWHWHDGGTVEVGTRATVALRDLTGFEGRCDSVLFCADAGFVPTDDPGALAAFRRELRGLPAEPDDGGRFDLVVAGGGLAGLCAAVSAARSGLSVALIQDRPVLGGNASSEVRVWPEGVTGVEPFPHIGDILGEILPPIEKKRGESLNGTYASNFDDARKLRVVEAEPNIALMLEHRVMTVQTDGGRIRSLVARHTRSGRETRVSGTLFADCTGDAKVGFLAGADHEFAVAGNMGSSNLWRVMDASAERDVLRCECKDKDALTAAFERGATAQPFPRCPWAIDLSDKPFPGREGYKGQWGGAEPLANLGGWFWESGFDKDPIRDIERIRDQNFRAMYGAWDALKNVDGLYPNHRLGWAAFIAGKRESRRLLGDVILNADDFRDGVDYPDKAFPCSWHIDLHAPDDRYDDLGGEDPFISVASAGEAFRYEGPYWAPYRCLYSRNIENLFMAGRDISVSKEGLGPVRVMRTCGMMGEVVGKAAAVCISRNTTPRGVYLRELPELHRRMSLPGRTRLPG